MVGMRVIGGAILVIMVIILAVLVFLGDLSLPKSVSNLLGVPSAVSSQCLPNAGFVCSNISYSASTGDITLNWGMQDLGASWTNVNWTNVKVAFVSINDNNYSQQCLCPASFASGINVTSIGELQPGNPNGVRVTLKSNPQNRVEGTNVEGTIWVSYSVAGNSIVYYQSIAGLTINTTR
jgi:hypothetical protein